MAISIVDRAPTVAEYQGLESAVGFRTHNQPAISQALSNSVFAVCAIEGSEIVGSGRIVGDGAISFLLTNILVIPSHQRMGIGTAIVNRLCTMMETLPWENMVLEVAPLAGLKEFYERNGFRSPGKAPPGMVRWFNEKKS